MTVQRRIFPRHARPIRGLLLYSRHRIDVSARDLLFGISACLWAFGRRRLEAEVGRAYPPVEDALACFSVRSGFDLLLGALALAPGEEVLVSAVTHPDMVRIIEAHGLRAVPVDLETSTLEPQCELLWRRLSLPGPGSSL
jgi:perosamine synthetase